MILKEKCPECNVQLELKRACCKDRAEGWLLVKKCPECGAGKGWDPREVTGSAIQNSNKA